MNSEKNIKGFKFILLILWAILESNLILEHQYYQYINSIFLDRLKTNLKQNTAKQFFSDSKVIVFFFLKAIFYNF